MVRCSDEETLNRKSVQFAQNDRWQAYEIDYGRVRDLQKGSVGFWSWELNQVRLEVFKKWVITTIILCTFISGILSLYWGSLFRVEANLSSLVVFVVDFDGQIAPYVGVSPVVGPMIIKVAESLRTSRGSIGWEPLPTSIDFDPIAVRQAVYDQKAWAAVIINANATALLQDAVTNGNTSYDPAGAAQVIYVEARDETTLGSYVLPQIEELQTRVIAEFGTAWARQVLQQASSNLTILTNIQNVAQAISPAIGFSTFNLRPFSPPVATPAISIGLIYLIIISFFSFGFYLPIHMIFIQSPASHRPLHFYQLIIWRLCATLLSYFFLSLFYSLVSFAFQIPFSAPSSSTTSVAYPTTAYGHWSFVVYWMVNWTGMIALGLACENVAMIVGQPWTAFWLISWVIANVETAFYELSLAPRFYAWGYTWPLHQIVNASRTILFDVHSKIGLNFGILLAWGTVNTILFPFCCHFMRWKTMRAKRKEVQGQER